MTDLKKYNAENFDYMESSLTVLRHVGLFSRYLKGRVLDIGCGRGAMKRYVSGEYHGVDICEKCGEYVENFKCIDASREKLPYENGYFDTVLMLSVLEHVENFIAMTEEAGRVLKKGGHVVIVVPNPRHILYNGAVLRRFSLSQNEQHPHIHSFTEEDLRNLFFIAKLTPVMIDRVGNKVSGKVLPEWRPLKIFAEDLIAIAQKQ